jgi:3-phytase
MKIALLAAFSFAAASAVAAERADVAAFVETAPSMQDDVNSPAIWLHPTDLAKSLVLGSSGTAGLELYSLEGKLRGRYTGAEVDHVDVRYGFPLRGAPVALIVAYDRKSGGLLSYILDANSARLVPVAAKALDTGSEVTGLCLYRSAPTGRYYAFAATDDGSAQQWELYERNGKVDGRLVRTIPIGVGAGFCAADDDAGSLYITEEKVGIWKLAAEPETDAERTAVDLIEPRGHIAEEVKGLALYKTGAGRGYLLAADTAPGRINVYSLQDDNFAGSFAPTAGTNIDPVNDMDGLAAASIALSGQSPSGLIAVSDADNDGEAGNYKLFSWRDIVAALGLDAASGADPRVPAAPLAKIVKPTVETQPVEDYGDAADDPAVWVHPKDPAQSLIIATQKKRGLHVYDLSGKRLQVLADGRLNNVDLRQGFKLGGGEVALVAASNRTSKSLALYSVDPNTRRLSDVAAGTIATGLQDPYGLCMYRSPKNGAFYVFINNADDGMVKQWKLTEQRGKVGGQLVRQFAVGSQAEGCVADDEARALYVAEEDVGIWRYSAEPNGGTQRTRVDSTKGGHLKADIEGLAVYQGPHGTGYLIASNQGANDYAVYRREGKNEFIGFFTVAGNDALGIDGTSETDGIDVSSAALGPAFPNGVFVVQDGRNISPRERQNYKLVPWQSISAVLELHGPAAAPAH